MSSAPAKAPPPDQSERDHALDSSRSILVQAPAGSGKTDLLTRRHLRLLGEANSPDEIVAITFTNAAAAEMRHRILGELEKATAAGVRPPKAGGDGSNPPTPNALSMEALAARALRRSMELGWNLLDSPAQLRISTIDSFCRELALEQPLLSRLGGGIEISENTQSLYRRAARRTLESIDGGDAELTAAIAALLGWRDNNWMDLEDQLVRMLDQRDRWMHGFVLEREADWEALRERLERPLARAVRDALSQLFSLLDLSAGARDEILALARFACEEPGSKSPHALAECSEIVLSSAAESLDSDCDVFRCIAEFLLTLEGEWRSPAGLNKNSGFHANPRGKLGKARFGLLIDNLEAVPGLHSALAGVRDLPSLRYTDDEWRIVRACFALLRHAAAELQVVFAEAGMADFTEIAQTALHVLRGEDGQPTDAALRIADGIRHLLVDEFQDTSRRQHELLARLVGAWPDREGRTGFVVGDPMQSIYFFRDADAELFPRVRDLGLELPVSAPLAFDPVRLSANFRTAPGLVETLNAVFERIFAAPDGSGIRFAYAQAGRETAQGSKPLFELHLDFVPKTQRSSNSQKNEGETEGAAQTAEIVELIRARLPIVEEKRARGEKYRIAVLARSRKSLAAVAEVLREAAIPFRALGLERLAQRPEVQDALALAHALLNGEDRVAWLGVLRAPWCGLSIVDLHTLASADDETIRARPVPGLLSERLARLSAEGQAAAQRVLEAMRALPAMRVALPNAALGTWLEQIWLSLGGAACVDAAARANLDQLWTALDKLPNGEQDLLSPALDAALADLNALSDPAASSEWGVQLMTIHKAKGLEFEVVVVPDLEAHTARNGGKEMLSWLERGLPSDERDPLGEVTEFLIAPLQSKGSERGRMKAWVDRERRDRERQEERRILYVAATRAREELHLFARPAYTDENGAMELVQPERSLFATAWPALEEEVRKRFDAFKAAISPATQPADLPALAAAAEIVEFPATRPTATLRRLPADYRAGPESPPIAPRSAGASWTDSMDESPIDSSAQRLYERHEGGVRSRAFGLAMHRYLEELAQLRAGSEWPEARDALARFTPRVAAEIRAFGIDAALATSIAADSLNTALTASHDRICQWILDPHAGAASEARWTGIVNGVLRTVQVDRVFRSGNAPQLPGEECWWIVDYKTAHEDASDSSALLARLRPLYAAQIEAYAAMLRNLHGSGVPVRAGLYYPRMNLFDWWEM